MSRAKGGRLVIGNLRGRDGSTDSPLDILPDLCAEALNVDFARSGVAQKRRGSAYGITDGAAVFTAAVTALIPYVPGNDVTLAQLFGVDGNGAVGRVSASSAWVAVSCTDAVTGSTDTYQIHGVTFNGKLFITYNSAAGRLHCWDPDDATIRRVGLGTPAAPSAANTGAGAYAATQRWYRQRYRRKSGSTVKSESEASAAVAFTPSGGGTAARVTKAASISEGETHWVLEGSSVGTSGPWYELAETAVGTTTYDDSAAPSSYASNTASQPAGTFTVPESVKYLLRVENRLLMAGTFGTSLNNRVWFTAARGALRADDERIPQTVDLSYYVDLAENDGGVITGMGGPLNGQPIVFKEKQIWRLVPTGDDDAPYEPRLVTDQLGAFNQRGIVMGADELGRPALYFQSLDGPYRLGARGLEYLGTDIQDIWDTADLSDPKQNQWAVRYAAKKQIWLSLVASSTRKRLKFHERLGRPDETGAIRGGWTLDDGGAVATAIVGCVFATTPGSPMSRDQKPYVQIAADTGPLLRCDETSVYADNGTTYLSYVETKPQNPAGDGAFVRTGTPLLTGKSTSGTPTMNVLHRRNYDSSLDVTASTTFSTQRAAKLVEAGEVGDDAYAVAFRIGDAASTSVGWTLDRVVIPWEPQGEQVSL